MPAFTCRRALSAALTAAWCGLSLTAATPAAAALSPGDRCICEALIADLQTQQDLIFIRNGDEHSAEEAADHLRMKLDGSAGRLNSVDDFIDKTAAGSWITGREYQVMAADGSVMTARQFLRAKLQTLDISRCRSAAE